MVLLGDHVWIISGISVQTPFEGDSNGVQGIMKSSTIRDAYKRQESGDLQHPMDFINWPKCF